VGDAVAAARDTIAAAAADTIAAARDTIAAAVVQRRWGTAGAGRTIVLLERARLPVPDAILDAAIHQRPLFNEPAVDGARFFVVAA
jgi:hypothetical protein